MVDEINNDPLSHKKITPRVALILAGQGPTVQAFPGLKHDMLREPDRDKVHQALQQWLTRIFPA